MLWNSRDAIWPLARPAVEKPSAIRRWLIAILVSLAAYSAASSLATAGCDAKNWLSYKGIKILRIPNSTAYFYVTSNIAIDADGAPNAYHPDDIGLDALANAWFPDGDWKSVLVVDPDDASKPFIQPSGEFAGYFLSMTSLHSRLPDTDAHRYVDALTTPYIVFPGKFYHIRGTGIYGDFAVVRNLSNGKQTSAIVADGGMPDTALGEVSISLAERLGGHNVNPRTGAGQPTGPFVYLLFPRSRMQPPWPVTVAQLDQRATEELASVGGWDRIMACVQYLRH